MRYLAAAVTILILLTQSAVGYTQQRTGMVKGLVVDTLTKSKLGGATVNVLQASDSTLVSFTRSKESGQFEVGRLNAGNYLLLVSYTGFASVHLPFTITAEQPLFEFPLVAMTSNSSLDAVTVIAAPVMVKGDTVEYNAGSFKSNKPNAVVEDLLKRLPGVEVDKDGNIKANGQDVKRVLVDGKEFFGNDPKLATKNLQADMVNKVQVFDKKSDKSDFTGFDDGNSEPTINLTLKNDKRQGVFGRIAAGGGTEERYQANANVNSFKKGEQLSFIGQANNINQQGFSLMDALAFSGSGPLSGGGGRGGGGAMVMGGRGGGAGGINVNFGNQSQGITSTQAIGGNYNNFKTKKQELTSSYFFNGTQLVNDYYTERQTAIGDSFQLYREPGSSNRSNYNHRINAAYEYKPDSSNSFKITPAVSLQNTRSGTQKSYTTFGEKGNAILQGLNNTNNENEGYNGSLTALWRHRFARRGRTFSAQLNAGKNYSQGQGGQYTQNNMELALGGIRADTIDQRNNSRNNNTNLGVNLSYTEPMSRRSLMEFTAYHTSNISNSLRNTYDFNKLTKAYDKINARLSNEFDNTYLYSGAGINFKENRTGWNYTIGANLQRSEIQSEVESKGFRVSQQFVNVLPNANLQIGKNRFRNFRVFYNGTVRNPSINQLQPIENVSDPLNVTRGNPNLKQEFTNNLRINYTSFDPYTMKNFFVFANVRQTSNAIVNYDSLARNGARLTTYANANGVYAGNASAVIGLPLKLGETKANLSFTTGVTASRSAAFLNAQRNNITNITLTERASVNYNFKELFDLRFGGNVSFNNAQYSLQTEQNNKYYSYGISAETNWRLPGRFALGADVEYTANSGRAAGFNPAFTLLNTYLSKTFLKNDRGELRLYVFDVLGQNTGIDRTVNSNYVEDTRYTVLQRYATLTFTYSLSKFGGNAGGMGRGTMIRIDR